MSDLINRQDVIDILYKYTPFDSDGLKLMERLEERINDLPSADRPQEWIPCSERLPSEKDYIDDVVIWCTDKGMVGVGWYYEITKSWATIDDTFPPILGEVIAWMPLPQPWEGADDEDN